MAQQERNAERDHRWWREYCAGTTLREIAKREQVGVSTVSEAIKKVRDSIPEAKREEIRQEVHELYRRILAESMEIADMLPPPVVAGKDGNPVVDPEHPDKVYRDYSGRLRALETAAQMADRMRKMFGVDEAQRVIVDAGEDEAARRAAAEAKAYLEQREETDQ
jgi:DNA-binding transcriptional regulator LsrR (DeoR family)